MKFNDITPGHRYAYTTTVEWDVVGYRAPNEAIVIQRGGWTRDAHYDTPRPVAGGKDSLLLVRVAQVAVSPEEAIQQVDLDAASEYVRLDKWGITGGKAALKARMPKGWLPVVARSRNLVLGWDEFVVKRDETVKARREAAKVRAQWDAERTARQAAVIAALAVVGAKATFDRTGAMTVSLVDAEKIAAAL